MALNVFKIQTAPAVQPENKNVETAVVGREASTSEEMQSNGSVTQSTVPAGGVVDQNEIQKPNDPSEMVIKVEGPVGQTFTNVLNKLLATEGLMTTLPVIQEVSKDTKKAMDTIDLVEVYCWRTDAVNTSDLVEVTNSVTKHTDRQFVIALERADNISDRMQYLEALQKLPNVKLCMSMESAANFIRDRQKAKK